MNTKLFLAALLLLLGLTTTAQLPTITKCLGRDTVACIGQPVKITICNESVSSSSGVTLNAPTSVSLTDDQWSQAIDIGFTFSFYGVDYTKLIIGSNGLVSFQVANAGTYCSWAIPAGTVLPSSTAVAAARNSIMISFQDLNPASPDTPADPIQYQTLGTAPNRKFVVLFKSLASYDCGIDGCAYSSMILYEGTNQIDLFIGNKKNCLTWNGGLASQGIQNEPGTDALMVAGRNCSQWSANQDGQRFIPTSATNTSSYTTNKIPYVFVDTQLGNQTMWVSTAGQTYPYNNGVLTVNQIEVGPIGYFLAGTACGNSVGAVSDTTFIKIEKPTATVAVTGDVCGLGIGAMTVSASNGTAPYTYRWPTLANQTTATVTNVGAGSYQVIVLSALGCKFQTTTAMTNTAASFSNTTTKVKCKAGSDGTATAAMTPNLPGLTYLWSDEQRQTTATATGLKAGSYTCTLTSENGCTGTTTAVITEIPEMTVEVSDFKDIDCYSKNNGEVVLTAAQGTEPYSYSWDNSSSTSNTADNLIPGVHTITVKDANGCEKTITQELKQPAPLQITVFNPTGVDTICPTMTALLSLSAAGGSTPYQYEWKENGVVIGNEAQITVKPENNHTVYCVRLSENCGSPVKDTCLTIDFPDPIIPALTTNLTEGCAPARFEFTNISNHPEQIETTVFDFGDDLVTTEVGADSTSHVYTEAESFAISMTVTSVYGCVYKATFQDVVLVSAIPTADFALNSNPTTIFNTKVTTENRSSDDVLKWIWDSPFSVPTTSKIENPDFKFQEGVVGSYPISLKVINAAGCTDSVTYFLNIVSDITIFAPNSFTPNGDEFNQKWRIHADGIDKFSFVLTIYNRWGQEVYVTDNPEMGWDGTYKGRIVEDGTYTWKAIVKNKYNDERQQLIGNIVVIK